MQILLKIKLFYKIDLIAWTWNSECFIFLSKEIDPVLYICGKYKLKNHRFFLSLCF
jgi:hypothetical protein